MVETYCKRCNIEIDAGNPQAPFKFCATCKVQNQRDRCKAYKAANRKHVAEYNKVYKKENKGEISTYNSKYFSEHKEEIYTRRNVYINNDVNRRKMFNLRGKTARIFKGKIHDRDNIYNYIGCTHDFFVEWIRSQLTGDQSLYNHGIDWHLDHCLPCSKFDASDDQEIKKCFHWSNVQPVNGVENQSKGSRTTIKEQNWQMWKMGTFIKWNDYTEGVDYNIIDYDRNEYIDDN